MSKKSWSFVTGSLMLVVGVALFMVFKDVETSVIRWRPTGAVIAVFGIVELIRAGMRKDSV